MILLIGVVMGMTVGYLVAILRSKGATKETSNIKIELRLERERHDLLNKDFQEVNRQLREERERIIELNNQNAELSAEYRAIKERLAEQKKELDIIQERFKDQFKNLANEIFEEKTQKFTDQNKSNIDSILKPLGDKLLEFERKVDQSNKDSIERNSALKEQIIGLRELNHKMSKEAENLTKALKGDSKVQGDWGEIVLERILERSGLEKDREYFLQETYTTDEGRRLRPDVIIKLPDNKNLVIDAKVSLTAYEKYVNGETEEDRQVFLKEHLLSLKSHIKGLADKNYHRLFDSGTLDYVLMFVPIETAFSLLVQEGGDLYNEAHNKNIIIVSPATLVATLRTVASIWKHEYQNRNALEIAKQGGALYDKFVAFAEDLIKVGNNLRTTTNTYNDAMSKLSEGQGNLIRKTQKLKELGAKASKQIDQRLLNRARVEDDESKPIEEPPVQNNLFG